MRHALSQSVATNAAPLGSGARLGGLINVGVLDIKKASRARLHGQAFVGEPTIPFLKFCCGRFFNHMISFGVKVLKGKEIDGWGACLLTGGHEGAMLMELSREV
jgi:hypothetical protein